jgi:hypothetical protein
MHHTGIILVKIILPLPQKLSLSEMDGLKKKKNDKWFIK